MGCTKNLPNWGGFFIVYTLKKTPLDCTRSSWRKRTDTVADETLNIFESSSIQVTPFSSTAVLRAAEGTRSSRANCNATRSLAFGLVLLKVSQETDTAPKFNA